jgi:ankyrin repeat protein
LRERGVDLKQPDSRGKTPFEHALAANKVAVARYLLQQTDVVNLNKEMSAIGSPFLHMVCEKGYVDMAALLIEMGADINVLEMKDTPLCVALRRNDVPLTRLLLAAGAEINMRTMTCIPKDSAEIQTLIKQYGSSKQYMESHGETILHTAIRLGVEDHFALLTRIENIVSPNKEGVTPVQLAIELKKPQFVRMLQEAGAAVLSEAV